MKYFSEQELNYIVLHKEFPDEELAYYLKKSKKEIAEARKTLKISKPKKKEWTSDEIEFLKNSYGKMQYRDMEFFLHRSISSISRKAGNLGISKGKPRRQTGTPWTDEEIKYLKGHRYESIKNIAKVLNRSESSVRNKQTILGLRKPTRKYWTKRENNFIYENIDNMTYEEMAKVLKKSIYAVKSHCMHIGLSKNGVYLNCKSLENAFDTDQTTIRRKWIEKYGLPVKKMQIGKNTQYRIEPEEFWAWCEKHLDIVPMHLKFLA